MVPSGSLISKPFYSETLAISFQIRTVLWHNFGCLISSLNNYPCRNQGLKPLNPIATI